jgi:hypothetical protein
MTLEEEKDTDYTYKGGFYKNRKTGKGTCTWKNGEKYVGNWINNKMDTETGEIGVYTYPDKRRYEGEFHNGFK